jgi:hypothetical protein
MFATMKATMIRGNSVFIYLTLGLLSWTAGQARAQEDPFATKPGTATKPPASSATAPDNPAGANNAGGVNADGTPSAPIADPVARQVADTIRKSNPKTPRDLALAVTTLLDVNQPQVALTYLEQLDKLPLTDTELHQLMTDVGSDVLFRIHSTPELQPLGPAFAKRVFTASRQITTSVERLDQAIRNLSNGEIGVRSAAYRELRRIGQPAVVAMLNTFADRERRSEFAAIRDALHEMGLDALQPLLGASRASKLQVRYEALLALAHLDHAAAYDAAAIAAFSPLQPEPVRQDLQAVLRSIYGKPLDRDAVSKRVRQNAEDLLTGRTVVSDLLYYDRQLVYVKHWRWDETLNQMQATEVSPATSGRWIAWDRFADLVSIYPEDPAVRQLYLLATMDATKRLQGPDQLLDPTTLSAGLQALTVPEIEAALHVAIDRDLIPAACGLCQWLGQRSDAQPLISGKNNNGLVRALQCGDRHTQFAAFQAIAGMDFKQAYPGSSYVLAAAIFFANFGDRPSGIIGHQDIGVARDLAAAMNLAGLTGRGVAGGRELFQEAISDSNLQVLFVSDTLNNPLFTELISQLRNDWRTKRLPIAILTRSSETNRSTRMAKSDSRLLALPETSDATLVALQVDQVRRLAEPWTLDTLQGRMHAQVALEWLAKIIAAPQDYRFYDTIQYDQAIADLVFVVEDTNNALQILGGIASAKAQRALLDYANQNGLPMDLRQKAVEAFSTAIAKRGVLLTTAELEAQYQRYNASEQEPGAVQRIYGSILDAIENRTRGGSTSNSAPAARAGTANGVEAIPVGNRQTLESNSGGN